jgi:hypothetical protein
MQDLLVLRKCNELPTVRDDWQKEDGARKSAPDAELDAVRACRFPRAFASEIFTALQSSLKDLIGFVVAWLLALCKTMLGKKLREVLQSKVSIFPILSTNW